MMERNRCDWSMYTGSADPLYRAYHDEEWGRPVHDDKVLFEFMILELMQAGLSWATILRKRSAFRGALDGFDVGKVARYGEDKIETLMKNAAIIRN